MSGPKPEIRRDKPLGSLPWDVNDYRASRTMNALTPEGRAIVRELVDEIWHEGYVPNDPYEIAAIARWPIEVVALHWPTIRDKVLTPIENTDGQLYTHRRVEIERTEADRKRVTRQLAGRKGGLAKAGKKDDTEPNEQGSLALLSNATTLLSTLGRKEGKEEEKRENALGVASPLGGLTPARCPWCVREFGHAAAADCQPRRLTSDERQP